MGRFWMITGTVFICPHYDTKEIIYEKNLLTVSVFIK